MKKLILITLALVLMGCGSGIPLTPYQMGDAKRACADEGLDVYFYNAHDNIIPYTHAQCKPRRDNDN